MLIYSNAANGKTAKDTWIIHYDAIEGYLIYPYLDRYEIIAKLKSGRDVTLITKPSYDEAIAVVEKIEREAPGGNGKTLDFRFLQVHQDHPNQQNQQG